MVLVVRAQIPVHKMAAQMAQQIEEMGAKREAQPRQIIQEVGLVALESLFSNIINNYHNNTYSATLPFYEGMP